MPDHPIAEPEQFAELPAVDEEALGLLASRRVRTLRTREDGVREAGLVIWKGTRLAIPDLDALPATALFDPNDLTSTGKDVTWMRTRVEPPGGGGRFTLVRR